MLELAREAQKPLAITVLCTLDEEDYLRDTLGVPVFHFPEEAVQALALSRDLAARGEMPALRPIRPPCRRPTPLPRCWRAPTRRGFSPWPRPSP